MKLKNKKIAWVTGGGTGIGSEIVKLLVNNGWKVVISGRRIEKLKEIESFNKENISSFKLDVSIEKDCIMVVNNILKMYGSIDLVILNAAAYNPGHLDFSDTKKLKKVIDINLMGQINCLKPVLPIMKKKSGHIVFVSSPAGFRGLPNAGIYGVTKSALTFLAESLYLEYLHSKIKIQVIHPGFIKTPMTDKNNFPMPFLMTATQAAKRIYRELSSSKFEIFFPKRLIVPMKILNILPYKIYFFIMNKILKSSSHLNE